MLACVLLHMVPAAREVDVLANSCARLKGRGAEMNASETVALDTRDWDRGRRFGAERSYGALVCGLTTTFWEENRVGEFDKPRL
jgi:hypothetical protein